MRQLNHDHDHWAAYKKLGLIPQSCYNNAPLLDLQPFLNLSVGCVALEPVTGIFQAGLHMIMIHTCG